MKKAILFILFIGLTLLGIGQPVQVGVWRDYLPYNSLHIVVETDDFVYGASDFSLIAFDKRDNSVLLLSKVNGLSDIGVTAMGYHESSNTVVVGYENGNVDFIVSGRIENLADIKRAAITGVKQVNNIHFIQDNAYLACGFGIVNIDMTSRLIRETYFIAQAGANLNVNDIHDDGQFLYAAYDEGLMRAPLNSVLSDYRNWEVDASYPYPNEPIKTLASFNNRFFAVIPSENKISDTLMVRENGVWSEAQFINRRGFRELRVFDNELYLSIDGGFKVFDDQLNEVYFVFSFLNSDPAQPMSVWKGKSGTYWVADDIYGLIQNKDPFNSQGYSPSSPFGNSAQDIEIVDNHVWAAGGGRTTNFLHVFNGNGLYHRKPNTDWVAINRTQPAVSEDFYDVLTVEPVPNDPGHVFVGTLGMGLVEVEDDEIIAVYDQTNSPIKPKPQTNSEAITGLAFDRGGNLWMSNGFHGDGLRVLTREGQWISYNFSDYLDEGILGKMIITQTGQKWVLVQDKGRGIVVFDNNGTFETTADDQKRLLGAGAGNGGLHTTDLFAIAEDQNGEIWVGTNLGIAVFYNPSAVFLPGVNTDAQRIFVTVNGFTQYLLETETVTAIEIDGANRKWLGTAGSGVFLMSEDGTQEIFHFTEENSPLFSDQIVDIDVDPETGEVFFATERGIQAFRNSATGPDPTFSKAYAFPNPVEPDYDGPIAIKGLAVNSSVKITDINGQLVFETFSEGGQAIWNGKTMNGDRVQTGVYLVFATDETGLEDVITKILVVN